MNRRGFFGLIASAALVAAASTTGLGRTLGRLAPPIPILYGDGLHDDTSALNAMLSGQDVYHEATASILAGEDHVVVPRGMYALYDTLVIDRPVLIAGSHFEAQKAYSPMILGKAYSPMILGTENMRDSYIADCVFNTKGLGGTCLDFRRVS